MLCPNCNTSVPDGALYCKQCGTKLFDRPAADEVHVVGEGSSGKGLSGQDSSSSVDRRHDVKVAADAGRSGDVPASMPAGKTQSSKKMLPIVVAAIVVIVVAVAGYFGYQAYQADQAEKARIAAEQAEAAAREEAINAVDEDRAASDLSEDSGFMSGRASGQFVDAVPYEITSFTLEDKTVEDGKITIKASAELENEFFKESDAVTVSYTSSDQKDWQLADVIIDSSKIKPLRGISCDDSHGIKDASPSFDKKTGTCSVTTEVSVKKWYVTLSGNPTYTYKFNGTGWEFDKAEGEITHSGTKALEGTYKDPRAAQHGARAFDYVKVSDVDEAAGTCKVEWKWHSESYNYKWLMAGAEYIDTQSGKTDGKITVSKEGVVSVGFGESLEGGLDLGEINAGFTPEDAEGTILLDASVETEMLREQPNAMLVHESYKTMVRDNNVKMVKE